MKKNLNKMCLRARNSGKQFHSVLIQNGATANNRHFLDKYFCCSLIHSQCTMSCLLSISCTKGSHQKELQKTSHIVQAMGGSANFGV